MEPLQPGQRYRCKACGNLTRFDVITTITRKAFHHLTVGGELELQEVVILSEEVKSVECRWCGTGKDVEEVPNPSH